MWISAMQLVGLVVLILEIWVTAVNIKAKKQTAGPLKGQKHYVLAWLIGIPLGIASVFMWYTTQGNQGQQYKIIGIPFLAAAFDEKGADYVSPITPIFMGANFIFWFLIPQLFFWGKELGSKRKRTKRDAITNQEDTPA